MEKEALGEYAEETTKILDGVYEHGISSKENILISLAKWQIQHIQRIENDLVSLKEELKVCRENLLDIPTREDISSNYCTRLWLLSKVNELRAKFAKFFKFKG